MDLHCCPNCMTVFGDVQESCPTCGADAEGTGAELEFDVTTRSAISRLGGLFGGILPVVDGEADGHVLWCAHGVCLFQEEIGLAWCSNTLGRVDEVKVDRQTVKLRAGGRDVWLLLRDGSVL